MEVKVTGHGHSARNSLHYIFYGSYDPNQREYNKAKANANGITKRNELVVGYNCHNGYKHALKDFDNYLEQKPKNKVQTLNIVLSFAKKDFDFRKHEDCFEASTIARHFMKKAFPNHQAIIALQQDNQRAIPHIHLIICALSMQPPYKTIPGGHSKKWYQQHPNKPYQVVNYGVEHLRHIGKDCLNEYNDDFNRSLTGITQRGQSTISKLNPIQSYISNAVENAVYHSKNKKVLRKILRNNYGIIASFKHHKSRRRHKHSRQGRRIRYKRDGVVFRYDEVRHDQDGHIMYRKTGNPRVHRHYLKSSTLARFNPKLSYRNIIRILNINQGRSINPSNRDNHHKPSTASLTSLVPLTDSPQNRHKRSVSNAYSSASHSYSKAIDSIKEQYNPRFARNLYIPNPNWHSLINDFHNYENVPLPSFTINKALPKMSSDKVRKSSPFVYGPVLQTAVVNQDQGVKEFHVISQELKYTNEDVSLFQRIIDPLINGFRSKEHELKKWAYVNWRKGKGSIRNYFHEKGWDKVIAKYNPIYKRVWSMPTDGSHGHWDKERVSQKPIYKHSSHPFKLSDLIPLHHKSLKSRIHFISNAKINDYNAWTDRMNRVINSVDILPKSISDGFSGLVSPIMQLFNNKSDKASKASSASISASSASADYLAGVSSLSANNYSSASMALRQIQQALSSSNEAWESSYSNAQGLKANNANKGSNPNQKAPDLTGIGNYYKKERKKANNSEKNNQRQHDNKIQRNKRFNQRFSARQHNKEDSWTKDHPHNNDGRDGR